MGRKLGSGAVGSAEATIALASTGCPALMSMRAKREVLPVTSAMALKLCGGTSFAFSLAIASMSAVIVARAGMSDLATTTATSPVVGSATLGPPGEREARKMNDARLLRALHMP